MTEFDSLEWLRERMQIEQGEFEEVMNGIDKSLRARFMSSMNAAAEGRMLIITYTEQLKMLADEERVDLLDAVRHAGLPTSTYYRSIEGGSQLKQSTAETIAQAIRELSAR